MPALTNLPPDALDHRDAMDAIDPLVARRLVHAGAPVLLFDAASTCRYANPSARVALGLGGDGPVEGGMLPPGLLLVVETALARAARPGVQPEPVLLEFQVPATGARLEGLAEVTPDGVAVHLHDVRRYHEGLPESADAQRLRQTLDGVDAIVCQQDFSGAPLNHSPAVERILGWKPEQLPTFEAWDALIHPDDLPACMEMWLSGAETWLMRYRMRHADGHWVWIADRGRWIEQPGGTGRSLFSVAVDATEIMERELELRASEARYRILTETAPDAILTLNAAGVITSANPAAERLFGWTQSELVGLHATHLLAEEHREEQGRLLATRLAGEGRTGTGMLDLRAVRKDGSVADVEVTAASWGDEDDRVLTAFVRDATERHRAQADMLRLATAMQLMSDSVVVANLAGDITYVNPAFERTTGYSRDEVLGQNPRILKSGEHPLAFYESMWAELTAGKRWTGELVNRHKDGTRFVEEAAITPIRDTTGGISAFVAVKRNVTAERAALAALVLSEHRLRATIEGVEGAIIYQDEPNLPMVLSPQCERILGYRPDEIDTYEGYDRHVHPDDLEATLAAWQHPSGAWDLEYRFQHADGRWLWLSDRGRRERFPDGTSRSTVSVLVDVTARRNLEAQLRQAQRLEAVGQLAGGVADDMNNILAAISGYARFVADEVVPGSAAAEDIRQVTLATDRASALTRQLLAFSRRQPLEPRVVDVSAVIDGITPMLGRLLGEHIDIRVTHQPDLPAVLADAGQLEQVIVNLAVNARDAMPEGGRLEIRTSAPACPAEIASPVSGRCVRIEVEDTGTGMDEATLAQVFTPFFTTKELGRGTGLGLATVYGIITGSGGRVSVSSAPGRGARFVIELPGAGADPPGETSVATPGSDVAAGGVATAAGRRARQVLLVEDEPSVRTVMGRLLKALGYEVVSAASGAEALAMAARSDFSAEMVVSDVRMPGMQGTELVRRLRDMRPDFPAVFLSGYAPGAEEAAAELRVTLLQKPCSAAALGKAVAAALDQERTPA